MSYALEPQRLLRSYWIKLDAAGRKAYPMLSGYMKRIKLCTRNVSGLSKCSTTINYKATRFNKKVINHFRQEVSSGLSARILPPGGESISFKYETPIDMCRRCE